MQFVFENRDEDVVAGRYKAPEKENAHQGGKCAGMVVLIHGFRMACKKQHSPLKSNYLENYFGANAVIARIFLVNIVKSTIIKIYGLSVGA
jgi:hypothetical protein